MILTPIKSSNIAAYHYDPHSRDLTLQFVGGAKHVYADVPQERVDGMLNNGSAGKYFHKFIRNGFASRKAG